MDELLILLVVHISSCECGMRSAELSFAVFIVYLYFSLVFIKYSLIIFKIYCIINLQNVPDAKGRYSPENKGRKIIIRNAK